MKHDCISVRYKVWTVEVLGVGYHIATLNHRHWMHLVAGVGDTEADHIKDKRRVNGQSDKGRPLGIHIKGCSISLIYAASGRMSFERDFSDDAILKSHCIHMRYFLPSSPEPAQHHKYQRIIMITKWKKAITYQTSWF